MGCLRLTYSEEITTPNWQVWTAEKGLKETKRVIVDQNGGNVYAEIKNTFAEAKYDWMFGDGGGFAATFYAKGNYSVFKKGNKYYFSASAGMKTLAPHRGNITPEGKVSMVVNGKEVSATNFAIPDGTSMNSKYYTSIGSVLVELPATGTVLINLNFSYHIVFGSQGQSHSATLTVPVQLRTIGFPRD